MHAIFSIPLFLFAGFINGSFALPTKYVTRWRFENIWLQYSLWAFILLPWIIALIFVPQIFSVYGHAPAKLLWIMMIGGFLFGAGQIGFALAIDSIGIGLAFVICLGLGTGLGFFLPLVFQYADRLMTPFGWVTLLGTLLAIAGLIVSAYAGKLRDTVCKKDPNTCLQKSSMSFFMGVFLAAIAGIFSAGQNFSFSLTSDLTQMALQMGAGKIGASMVMWPGFLIFTFIPYAAYMIYLHIKNRSFKNYRSAQSGKYFLFSVLMGLGWFGSLIFYSRADQLIGSLGPVVGWPLFMVLIILTSNFWGWREGEWSSASIKAKSILGLGLLFLVFSVCVLGFSASLS